MKKTILIGILLLSILVISGCAEKKNTEINDVEFSNVLDEMQKDMIKEAEDKSKNADLTSMSVTCDTYKDPASKKYGPAKISISFWGTGNEDNSVSMKDVNGFVNIKVFNAFNAIEDRSSRSIFDEYSKGTLLVEYSESLKNLKLETDTNLFGVTWDYIKLVSIDDLNLNTNNNILIESAEDKTYEYNYSFVPLWIDVSFKDNSEKEYRDILKYDSMFVFGGNCDAAKIIE